jgi:hypothetical protein
MDRLGEQHGYLVLFEPKTPTEIPWEQPLKKETLEHRGKRMRFASTTVSAPKPYQGCVSVA